MSRQHLVRVGTLGAVGRFTAVDAVCYPRYSRVVVRTPRGLELGEVLTPSDQVLSDAPADGSILRGVTVEDQLLVARLTKNGNEAFAACSARIAERNLPAVLMEVEPLFDGQTLVFYFLGDMTPELETLTSELAELYESHAQVRRFTEAVTVGCGPDCGTQDGGECKSCASGCAIAGACGVRH